MQFWKVTLLFLFLQVLASELSYAQAVDEQPTGASAIMKGDAQDNYQFESAEQRQVFLSLIAELRCPMCQNQNIADSDAMISHDMRRKVYQLLQQGKTEQEVIDFMKARYGDFVHYKPPVTPYTLWLWLLPVIFAVVALIKITRKPATIDSSDIESKLAKADELLKRED